MFGTTTPYLAAIGTLMYLVYCTRPNIAFVVIYWLNLKLSQQTSLGCCQTNHAIPQGHIGSKIVYRVEEDSDIKGYVGACYLSNPHQGKSHTSRSNTLEVTEVESCSHQRRSNQAHITNGFFHS